MGSTSGHPRPRATEAAISPTITCGSLCRAISLPFLDGGTGPSAVLGNPGRGATGSVRLYRGLLKSAAHPFGAQVSHTRTGRTESKLTPCPLNRGKSKTEVLPIGSLVSARSPCTWFSLRGTQEVVTYPRYGILGCRKVFPKSGGFNQRRCGIPLKQLATGGCQAHAHLPFVGGITGRRI